MHSVRDFWGKKMKSNETKVIYYNDELNDEFSAAKITPKVIDENYVYQGGYLRKVGRVFWYYILIKPFAYFFLKLKYGHKIINKDALKKVKNTGIFLYGNHTNDLADAFIPTMLSHPRGAYVIVNPCNVSMPVLGHITPALGAVPLPDNKKASKNFTEYISDIISRKQCIAVYPEAHIWPYCTWIRNFGDASLRYPVKYNVPVYTFTNTYQKRVGRKTPRMVTYVDGPFYPEEGIPVREKRKKLRDEIFETMKKRSENNTACLVEYIKKKVEE